MFEGVSAVKVRIFLSMSLPMSGTEILANKMPIATLEITMENLLWGV